MKKLILAVALACAGAVFAETKTWTGGGDGTSWSDAANWDSKGAPVSGADDNVVIANSSGALLTVTLDDAVSIGALEITGATKNDSVTLTGAGSLTITAVGGWTYGTGVPDCAFFVKCHGTTTVDVPISVPEGVTLNVGDLSCGTSYTPALVFNQPISGAGSLGYAIQWMCHIEMRAAHAYTGNTTIYSGSKDAAIHVYAANPFGVGGKLILKTAGIVDTLGGTWDYPIEFSGSGSTYLGLEKTLTFSQDFTDDGTFTGQLTFYLGTSAATVNVNGVLDLPNGTVYPEITANSSVTFNKKVTAKQFTGAQGWCKTRGNLWFMVPGNEVDTLQVGGANVFANVADAFGPDTVLHHMGLYLGSTSGAFDMRGKDQSLNRVISTIDSYCDRDSHFIKSSTDATLTLKPTEDALTACELDDKMTLVLDAVTAGVTQTFSNRVNTMKGKVIVKKGTLCFNGTKMTAKNVPEINVDGGTLVIDSGTAASFSAVTNITLGAGAMLKVAGELPLSTSGVKIRMEDESGRIDVGAGVTLMIDEITVGGTPIDGGTYSGDSSKGTVIDQITGSGTVSIPENETPTKAASWTGDGADANVTTLANWSAGTTAADLTSRGLYPTFAEKGDEAVFNQAVSLKGLVFDIPGGQPTNEFALTGAGPIKMYDLGLTAADPKTDEQFRYTVGVPLAFKKAQTWNIGPNSNTVTVALAQPVSGIVTLTKTGAGTLELDSANPNFDADFIVSGGKVVAKAAENAFGTTSTGTKLVFNQIGTGAQLEFRGTTVTRPVDWYQANNAANGFVSAEGTNVFQQTITIQNGNFTHVDVATNSVLRTEGTFTQAVSGYITFVKDGPGTYEIAGAFKFGTVYADKGTVRLTPTAGCYRHTDNVGTSYYMRGGRLEFTKAYQINNSWAGLRFESSKSVVELNGFNQHMQYLSCNYISNGGLVTSCKPATLSMCLPNVDQDMRKGQNVDYGGQLSLVMTTYSPKGQIYTNTINRAISTTGTLSVSNYAHVVMMENASWLNPTNGTVSVADQGVLEINRSKTFSRHLDLSLAGSGVIELAAGVRQRFAHLYLDGSATPAAAGEWGAVGSGAPHESAHIAGAGRLSIGPSRSCVILLK